VACHDVSSMWLEFEEATLRRGSAEANSIRQSEEKRRWATSVSLSILDTNQTIIVFCYIYLDHDVSVFGDRQSCYGVTRSEDWLVFSVN
jgi:hypothetical protein